MSPPFEEDHLQIHDAEGIKRMRAAGKLAAEVRDYAGTLVKVGVKILPSLLCLHCDTFQQALCHSSLLVGRPISNEAASNELR